MNRGIGARVRRAVPCFPRQPEGGSKALRKYIFPLLSTCGRSAVDQMVEVAEPARGIASRIGAVAPGLAMAGAVAFVASRMTVWETAMAQAAFGRPIAIAAPVIALLIGVAFHGAAARPSVRPGLVFAIKRVLRW